MSNKFAKQDNGTATDNFVAETRVEREASSLARETRQESRRRGVGSANTFLRRTMARNPTSTLITSAIRTIRDEVMIETQDLRRALENGDINFLPLDGNNHGAEISSILVAYRAGNDVAVITLGLASTAEDLGELYINDRETRQEDQGPISIARVPSDVFSESKEYRNLVREIVAEAYPGKTIHLAGQMILQANVDVTKPEEIRPAIYRTLESAESFLSDIGVIESGDYNLALFDPNVEFVVRTSFNNKSAQDDLGNVRRQDIALTMIAREPTERDGKKRTRTSTEAVVRGFMDATYKGQETDGSNGYWTEKNTQTYRPVFVITDLDTDSNAVEMPQLLLGLIGANLLSDSNRWIAAFNPTYTVNDPNQFVGGLGRDVPLADTPIERDGKDQVMGKLTPSTGFDYVEFSREAFYLDSLIVAIDVEDAGQLSPLQSLLVDAAAGDRQATEAVVSSLDTLFDGVARNIWEDMGSPDLFIDINTRVPLGTFMDDQGNAQDIRKVGLRYMANVVEDPTVVEDYDRGFYDVELDERRRLSNVLGILREITPSFKLTGYARRIFVRDEFFDLVSQSLNELGIKFGFDGTFDINSRRRSTRHLDGLGVSGHGVFRGRRANGRSARSSDGWGRSSQRFRG